MGELSLFKINNTNAKKLVPKFVALEKSLQHFIEDNMSEFFAIEFLASEYTTGKVHGGRIDSLGIDENNAPVILEYKRTSNENVINQGLFYLDWLLDHKAEFELLVQRKIGKEVSEKIDWSGARLLCIAGDFNKYDTYAVKQINRNIELIRYRKYEDLILFELVNATQANNKISSSKKSTSHKVKYKDKTFAEQMECLNNSMSDRLDCIREFILNLGDDVQEKETKLYLAFKKIKNFACVTLSPGENLIYLYLKLNPDDYLTDLNNYNELLRDVRHIGHWSTGDFEVKLKNNDDFEMSKKYIEKSYEVN
ncbi:DUF91 domain-containing protein [Clostridium sp. 'deep sea']|uniref:DUF5655 domain-containing protein n=1 Tax=Clostridium sp. 'deep sea' TaxID=2779445 RepID=UPI0018965041|nr:DUF5655 domain-containing protein [Clostridium sp. 'deep sea']QOR35756.1 DUF91 domain-containing protein [Clostridium sp. 'deep sea']